MPSRPLESASRGAIVLAALCAALIAFAADRAVAQPSAPPSAAAEAASGAPPPTPSAPPDARASEQAALQREVDRLSDRHDALKAEVEKLRAADELLKWANPIGGALAVGALIVVVALRRRRLTSTEVKGIAQEAIDELLKPDTTGMTRLGQAVRAEAAARLEARTAAVHILASGDADPVAIRLRAILTRYGFTRVDGKLADAAVVVVVGKDTLVARRTELLEKAKHDVGIILHTTDRVDPGTDADNAARALASSALFTMANNDATVAMHALTLATLVRTPTRG